MISDDRKQPVSEVSGEGWEHQHIRAGMAELEAGESVSNERVMEWLDSWGGENELPLRAIMKR